MRATVSREVSVTRLSIAVTVLLVAVLTFDLLREGVSAYTHHQVRLVFEVAAFAASILFLLYGNLLYQWCRLGFYLRVRSHVPASRDELERIYDAPSPSLAILIPSCQEEPRAVWRTILSAALTEYPEKSVVLLIDDPPHPSDPDDRRKLEEVRGFVPLLNQLFRAEAYYFDSELKTFLARPASDGAADADRLASLFMEAATRLQRIARTGLDGAPSSAMRHADEFFITSVIDRLFAQHAASTNEIRRRLSRGDVPAREWMARQYRRLAALFRVRFSSFERKQYASLSHDANKAMNLNSYIGLMEKSWREVQRPGTRVLEETEPWDADFSPPAADYLITVDAASVLLPDYALRLVHVMEQPEHSRLAIVQTPSSAFPGAPRALERVAGATTDLQYIVHQGFSRYGATFWVGANALIRYRALKDIKETRVADGKVVAVYIRDRTLIEETESSIDLTGAGWKLLNYPARLAYSATPADFGSLLIQRRRWSNGGLLMLPKLFQQCAGSPTRLALIRELLARFHYLASPACGSAALLLLFFYPFDRRLLTIWVVLAMLPYFFLAARDLRAAGYRYADLLRMYALNLLLVPVIMGGVLKSLEQAVTGAKVPFARTRKIAGRPATPWLYCVVELALPLAFAVQTAWDVNHGNPMHALFSAINTVFSGYALIALLGLRDIATDLVAVFAGPGIPGREESVEWMAGPRSSPTVPGLAAGGPEKRN